MNEEQLINLLIQAMNNLNITLSEKNMNVCAWLVRERWAETSKYLKPLERMEAVLQASFLIKKDSLDA